MDNLRLKFKSGNSVPVSEARITRKEFEEIENTIADKDKKIKYKQLVIDLYEDKIDEQAAKIDALMMEYCPEEMSAEQMINYANHQKVAEVKL